MDSKKTGDFIAELRKKHNITQQQLAEQIHIGREAVSKWERGVTIPDTASLVLLSVYFNVSVNELLSGELMSKTNKQKVNNTALRIITDKEKVIRKMSRFFILGICLIITFFLLMYFVINYNSNKVFVVYSNSDDFYISQGLLVVSRKKIYLKLGNIESTSNDEISKIEVYFKDSDSFRPLIITDDLDNVYVDLINYDEIFNKKSIKNIVNNLYVDIFLSKETKTIKLTTLLDYKNALYVPTVLDVEHIKNDKNFEVPMFIKENFKLTEAGNYKYYLKSKKTSFLYMPKIFTMYIDIANNDALIYYHLDNSQLEIIADENKIFYDFENDKCIIGNCKKYQDIINLINNNVYKKLKN